MKNGSTPKLHYGRLKLAEHARRIMRADTPAGTTPKDFMEPSYLLHYTRTLQSGDIIEAACDDLTWVGWFWVMYVSKTEVRVRTLWVQEFPREEMDDLPSSEHEIKWRGGAKWSIVHKKSGEVVKDRFEHEALAHAFLKRHLESMAR